MDMVSQMMLKVNSVFNDDYLDKLARETDFIQRKRKVYISLIIVTLLSFTAMTIKDKEISLYKAANMFVKNIRGFFDNIRHAQCAISWMKDLLSKFALKESRPNRPSTKRLLEFNYA